VNVAGHTVGEIPAKTVQIEAPIADETLYYCNSEECKKEKRGILTFVDDSDESVQEHTLQSS
jgi:hypothetical protein